MGPSQENPMTEVMKRFVRRREAALALATAAAVPVLAALPLRTARASVVGQPFPSAWLDTSQGPRQITAGQARATYVDFWASWCGPCKQSFPWMNEMHAKYAKGGLRIVAVNVDTKRADAEEFLARVPAQFAIAYDRERGLAKAVDVKAMPTSLMLDAQGRILWVHHGFASKDREKLEAALLEALK
jgi:cytochrome c biogenesis protein CcmG, thiol:disulfide interchange protein DsbE